MMQPIVLVNLLDDPLYESIAQNALEKQVFEFGNEEARMILDNVF
jgi:hypothetical protein